MIISQDDRADSDHIYTATIGRNGDVMMRTAADQRTRYVYKYHDL